MKYYDVSKKEFLSKYGENIVKLARYLLLMKKGDRLLTVSELAKMFKSGVGTIQTALQKLVKVNAVVIESRGHKGTYIISMNKSILWEYSLYDVLTGNMPLLYTKRLIGLASAIYTSFEENVIPISMSYTRGGLLRVKKLVEGKVDFTICSSLTAEKAIEENEDLEIYLRFGKETYTKGNVFIFKDETSTKLEENMNIGVDYYSYDHNLLTKMACRDMNVNFVSLSYNEIFAKLKDQSIDCTVWSLDEIKEKAPYLKTVAVKGMENDKNDEKVSEAVMLINKNNAEKMNAVKDVFILPYIQKIQREVLLDIRMPTY